MAVMKEQQEGVLDIGGDNAVKSFREKFPGQHLREQPWRDWQRKGNLTSFLHNGFWQHIDNKRETELLEECLKQGKAPCKKWKIRKRGGHV